MRSICGPQISESRTRALKAGAARGIVLTVVIATAARGFEVACFVELERRGHPRSRHLFGFEELRRKLAIFLFIPPGGSPACGCATACGPAPCSCPVTSVSTSAPALSFFIELSFLSCAIFHLRWPKPLLPRHPRPRKPAAAGRLPRSSPRWL